MGKFLAYISSNLTLQTDASRKTKMGNMAHCLWLGGYHVQCTQQTFVNESVS